MVIFKRIIKGGLLNFTRGGMVSFAAGLVVTITLSVITFIILLQAVLYSSLNTIKDKVDVTVYFNIGAPYEKIELLKNALEKLPEVKSPVVYVSAEDSLKNFRARHSGDYPTIAALDEIGTNPLGAYLNIKAKEISQYESIATFLKGDNALVTSVSPVIDKVNYHQNKLVIDRLNSIINGAQKLGFLVTLILVVISIVVTFNTIRLTIFISKEEIGVMRLVGASKMHIRGPFMIEGAIYGIIATVVTILLYIPITYWLGKNMTEFLGLNIFNYFFSNFFQIFAIILFSGIILGVFSSFLAARKYLNK
jgi:cell division transport system permease protein